jgi:hypothetical protein
MHSSFVDITTVVFVCVVVWAPGSAGAGAVWAGSPRQAAETITKLNTILVLVFILVFRVLLGCQVQRQADGWKESGPSLISG